MPWVICFIVGLLVGAGSVVAVLWNQRRNLIERERAAHAASERARAASEAARLQVQEVARAGAALTAQRDEFERRVISYGELQQENAILKRDLQNIDIGIHKLQLDTELLDRRQRELDERAVELAQRYLKETVKAVSSSLNPNNFAASKDRLLTVVQRCRGIGFPISPAEEAAYVSELKADYERVVRIALEREEQARIKAQIREEERLRREVERELAQTGRERIAIQAALDQALAEARDQHSEEVERLKARLAEAEARSQRALSMAQQTKAGNVYVISNVGTFGPGIFKVGMTRRLEPLDRIRELGDASVPFPFDVHMMISCVDAPSLECALHRALHKSRINRVNPRKEFFRTELQVIVDVVKAHHGCVEYVADPEALEYNQSLSMTEEDAEFAEGVFEAADDDDSKATGVVED